MRRYHKTKQIALLQAARYVAIRMIENGFLTICEVQVFAITVIDLPDEGFVFGMISEPPHPLLLMQKFVRTLNS